MQKLNDLSRSLTPLDPDGTLFRGSTRPDHCSLVLAQWEVPTGSEIVCLSGRLEATGLRYHIIVRSGAAVHAERTSK